MPDAKGRLCEDIYLNDISDFESWCVTPPENVVSVTDTFSGIFDDDGHTIYGLYSDWGYGLVRYNRGIIKGTVIRDSLIVGGDSSAGICRQNDAEIRDCLIYGELENRGGKDNNMSGICSLNQANIENCGFLGDMGLREGMVRNPDRAGICLKNKGEVRNCYNFMILPEELKGRKRDNYAIADGGEINCYVAENSNWDKSADGQILSLTEEERFRIHDFLENGLYEYYYPGSNPADSPGIFWWERAVSVFTEEAAGIFGRDEEICKAAIDKIFLQDELIAKIIYRISCRREVGLHELSFEASQEEEGFVLDIRSKNSVLRIRKMPWKYRQSNQFLWQLCTEALQEENVDSWEHGTYRICHPDKTWKKPERIILYRTRQDKAGLFYIVEDAVYQVMLPEDSDIQAWLFRAKEYLEDAYLTGSGEVKDSFTCLWEIAFQEICHGKAAEVGTIWRDDTIGKDIYAMASQGRKELLSSEEVINVMEHFTIASGNDVYEAKTFRDIEQLTGLKSLTIYGYSKEENGYAPIELDIRGWKLPEITSIRLSRCKLYDGRWLKEFPALKSLRMEYCGLKDISFVAELEGLTELVLEGNQIEDITPLSGLTELKELSLWNNNISDISPLKDMMKLQRVDISCNMVSDLSPLSDKKELLELRAYENLIQNIFPLKGLTRLQYLDLEDNQIHDFMPIQGMDKLFYLSVMGNPVQNIGNRIFTPYLQAGMGGNENLELLGEEQMLLEKIPSGQWVEAEALAVGDLNGDEFPDMAVIGREAELKLYLFLGEESGKLSYKSVVPVKSWIGGHYSSLGIIDNGRIVVQNWIDGRKGTVVYEWDGAGLKPAYDLNLAFAEDGYEWHVKNIGTGVEKIYTIVYTEQGHYELRNQS